MRDLLVIVPTRGRPASITRLWGAIQATAQARTDLIFGVDEDDAASIATLASLDAGPFWLTGPQDTMAGWTNRIAAMNTGVYHALASFGDDHIPRTDGWDKMLLDAIGAMGGTGIAYGDDLLQGERLPTAPVISSGIVAALGWMCEPSMGHFHVDDVWRDLGRGAGCLAYVPGAVIEHLHPGNGKAPYDATYAAGAARDAGDAAAYHEWLRSGRDADVAKVAALVAARKAAP